MLGVELSKFIDTDAPTSEREREREEGEGATEVCMPVWSI